MKKKLRVAISGLGRIGRAILKKNLNSDKFKITFLNDVNPDVKNLAYLINYDSTYGLFPYKASHEGSNLIVRDKSHTYLCSESLLNIDFDKYETDILILSSGVEKNIEEARELIDRGMLKKVIVTHCSDKVDKEIILGVNEDKLLNKHSVISNSICDSNAIAHILKWLNDEYTILNGSLTTLHPWLGYQNLLDSFSFSYSSPGVPWPDFALARSSIDNLIPKQTTAINAVENVLPEIKDKIISFSYRVPTNIVSSSDLTINLKKNINLEEFNKYLVNKANESEFVSLNYESLVSKDYIGNESSAIIDMQWTQKVNNTFKVVLWYDNEFGYASRVIDLTEKVGLLIDK